VRALIVEDDKEVADGISLLLHFYWPEAELMVTSLGREGIELTRSAYPDIIVLDLGLPDISGFEALREIRQFSSVPIIILTVKSEESDIVKGLEWGADDYIVKPYGQLELLARLRARLRDKNHPAEASTLTFGPLRLNAGHRELHCGQKEVDLTAIEAHIMHHLIRSGGHVATYSSLAEEVWGEDYPGSLDSLRVYIRRLREKIEDDPSHPQMILNKPGVGYYLSRHAKAQP